MKLPGEVVFARQRALLRRDGIDGCWRFNVLPRWRRVQGLAWPRPVPKSRLPAIGLSSLGNFSQFPFLTTLAETFSQGDGRALAQPGARHLGGRIKMNWSFFGLRCACFVPLA